MTIPVTGSSPRGRGTQACSKSLLSNVRFIPAWAGNTGARLGEVSRQRVHPRVGGEHALSRRNVYEMSGSSPRGRGTRSNCQSVWLLRPVHPRVGGEHAMKGIGDCELFGSSPRGRGTRQVLRLDPVELRFIPAWAGNTRLSRLSQSWCSGSSPRGRGTPYRHGALAQRGRFIPAWAGNTCETGATPQTLPVHPRVGGEHNRRSLVWRQFGGSSPRGRGTPTSQSLNAAPARFIPAWAGNTPRRSLRCKRHTVHPRVGGEHVIVRAEQAGLRGSSPRGRLPGTLNHQLRVHRRFRFIPAWAGNTITSLLEDKTIAVHPRVGGEHGGQAEWPRGRGGSSPRGRGTRAQCRSSH